MAPFQMKNSSNNGPIELPFFKDPAKETSELKDINDILNGKMGSLRTTLIFCGMSCLSFLGYYTPIMLEFTP